MPFILRRLEATDIPLLRQLNALFVYWEPLDPGSYRYAEAPAAKPKGALASLVSLFKGRRADDAASDDDTD